MVFADPALPPAACVLHALNMFVVSEAEAAAIRDRQPPSSCAGYSLASLTTCRRGRARAPLPLEAATRGITRPTEIKAMTDYARALQT